MKFGKGQLVDIEVEIGFMETRLKTNKMKEKHSQTEHLLLVLYFLSNWWRSYPGRVSSLKTTTKDKKGEEEGEEELLFLFAAFFIFLETLPGYGEAN